MQDKMAFESIYMGRQLSSNGHFDQAFDMYINAFEVCPELKPRIESEFRKLLNKFNSKLYSENEVHELFKVFEKALGLYPDNCYILNDLGSYLYKLDYRREACAQFQRALTLDLSYAAAEKNLNYLKNIMISRWHFKMLNDRVRNETYRIAIRDTVVRQLDTILDVGTGTGLLSLYANECGPLSITACETSDAMVDIAACVFQENNAGDITLINKSSNDLTEVDIGGRKSLLLTEIFDVGVFGEKILETLIYAWDNLLLENGRVLPKKAVLYVCGIESERLNLKYKLNTKRLSKFMAFNDTRSVIVSTDELYDSEDVTNTCDVRYATSAEQLLVVDFNNIDNLKNLYFGDNKWDIQLTACIDGEVNLFVVWFDLYLTDDIKITTNPTSPTRATAWEQALFYNFDTIPVSQGETVPVSFACSNGKLSCIDAAPQLVNISEEVLRFLNDSEYTNLIFNSVGAISIYLCQIIDISGVCILDLSPFPVLGLLMMMRGAKHLLCAVKTESDKNFFYEMFKANNISLTKIKILDEDKIDTMTFRKNKFHLIYTNILNLNGDLKLKFKELLAHLRISSLIPGGLMLPYKIGFYGKLVNCDAMDITNRIEDCTVSGYNIAGFINKYQVSQTFNVNLAKFRCNNVTDSVIIIDNCNDRVESKVINLKVIEEGQVNAVWCWYTVQLIENGGSISTLSSNSFIDSTVFLAYPRVDMNKNDTANILCCVDQDEMLKLIVDVD